LNEEETFPGGVIMTLRSLPDQIAWPANAASLDEPEGRAMSESFSTEAQRMAAIWNKGGRGYDRISETIADSIEHCVNRLRPQAGERILDLATGTGWAARRLAARGAVVVAVDFAEHLVEAGRALADAARLNIDFQVGNAERLDFPDGCFDAVISTCGVMFVRDPEAAAAELARVCRPDGRIALTTWPANSTVAGLFNVMRPYLPEPPSPAPPSPFDWGQRERITQLLGDRFTLRFETGTSVLREPDVETVWTLFSTCYGPTRTLAERLSPERLDALKRDFIDYHERYRSELGIALPREYLLTVGVRC
jgi:SAM-dependent methyltransferase